MNRPLVSIVLAYAAGLLFGQLFEPPQIFLFAAGLSTLASALIFPRLRPHLLWLLLLLTGWINLTLQTQSIAPNDLRCVLPSEPAQVLVRGTLPKTPGQRVYVRDDSESWRTIAILNVAALNDGHHWQAATGQILVTTPDVLPGNIFGGQQVEITGVIAPPPTPLAEGLFDYRTFLKRKGIHFELKTRSPSDWQLLSTNSTPPRSDRFLAWSQATLSRGLPAVDEPLKLLWAMTLGWRAALTDEVSAPFMQTGTMHIFAISGLHIALIAGILVAMLRAVQIPRFACGVIIIPLLWFYTAATGWQPSAIRSTLMMTIVIGGWMLKRPGDLLNSLAAAAFAILLCDPLQLFQASFQLSFFVVLSIALLMPPLEKLRDRLLQTDPLLPRELLPRWQRWTHPVLRAVLTWLAVSFAAWLGSWPLCAYYFHIFSPVTLLANLLIVPLSSLALASSLGSLICGGWLPWCSELFNHSAWFWMKTMTTITDLLVKGPHAYFYVKGPAAADFVIYYTTLFAVLSGVAFKKGWRVGMLLFALAAMLFYGWRAHETRQTATLTVLPLNGGHAVFIHAGNAARTLLVDCGDTNSLNHVTTPFLHAQGVNHLPRLALTQGDLRDIGGALHLCDQFGVENVFTSPVRFRSSAYRQIVAALDGEPGRRQVVSDGDSVIGWQVLYPAATNNFPQADDNSLVLRSELHELKILLLSDLGRAGQKTLLESPHDLRADIVVAGLPEKSQPLSDGLLEKIQPKIIIIADSPFPATRRAPADLRERLAQHGIPVIYTRTAGAVTLTARPDGWQLRTMDGRKFEGVSRREWTSTRQ